MPNAATVKRLQARIRALRKQRGWTQEYAAERCGMSYKVYQFLEIGVSDNPTLDTLQKLADGFDIGLHWLFEPELPPPPTAQGSPRRKR